MQRGARGAIRVHRDERQGAAAAKRTTPPEGGVVEGSVVRAIARED